MTPEEVIERLKTIFAFGISNCIADKIARDTTFAALEKQVPKKPKKLSYEPLIKHGWEYECPECSKAIGLNSVGFDFTDEDPFCPSCGQKIDWEETP